MKYIVEYSKSQNAFHLSDEKEFNLNLVKTVTAEINHNWVSDWRVLGEFDSYEKASRFIGGLR